jgi:mono/diheme cytochrome c family protein
MDMTLNATQQLTDGELYWKTAKGKTPMPVFEQKLNEKELWDVVAYVRTFAK